MFIPKCILSIFALTAQEPTRYAINGVQFSRDKNGRAQAVATNGHTLIQVKWDEKPQSGYSLRTATVEKFTTIMPRTLVNWLSTLAEQALLEEGDNPKKINIETFADFTNPTGTVITFPAITTAFPHVNDVIPTYEIVTPGENEIRAVRFLVTPQLLREVLATISKCSPGDTGVELIVPLNPNKPLMLKRHTDSCDVVSVVMPRSSL